jgi:tetratricopeptide (TPR) repeat protein
MSLSEAEKLFFKAVSTFREGNIIAAADLFSEIASKYPDFGKAPGYLGLLYFDYLKDPVIAEENFKNAISSSPEFTESYLYYAQLLLSQERFAEMNAHLNKVSEIPGAKKNEVYELFGRLNELMGKYDEAIDFYKKAIKYSFSDEDIVSYEKSMTRCNTKKKYV